MPLRESQQSEKQRHSDDGDPVVVSDADLVSQALLGDARAQEALFRRHRTRVFQLGCRLVGWSDADDLLQDCFVDALQTLHRLRDPAAFGGWLSAIVVRTAHNRLRRRRLLERLGLRRHSPVDIDMLVAPSAPPDVMAELQKVYGLLAFLPAEAQVALVLRRVEGLSLDEIAVKMDRSLATVKRRLAQAEKMLSHRLDLDGEKGGA